MGAFGWVVRVSVGLACGCGAAVSVEAPAKMPVVVMGPTATSAAATASPAPVAAPPHAVDACQVAQAFTDAAIARALTFAQEVMQQQLATHAHTGPESSLAPGALERPHPISCRKSPGGAWAIVLANAVLTPASDDDWSSPWLLDGELALAHVDSRGVLAHSTVKTQAGPRNSSGAFENKRLFPSVPNCCNFLYGGLEPLEQFDFDSDGETEVHVGATYHSEGVDERSDELFTFKAGRIERYAPAAPFPFSAFGDVTDDGRPELIMFEPLDGGARCGSGFPADGSALPFIAHSLPDGTFSKDDEVAREHAKEVCPERPTKLNDLADVLCARLWGADPAKLELQVRARFKPEDCDAYMAGRPQKRNATPNFELMLSATRTPLPFTLP